MVALLEDKWRYAASATATVLVTGRLLRGSSSSPVETSWPLSAAIYTRSCNYTSQPWASPLKGPPLERCLCPHCTAWIYIHRLNICLCRKMLAAHFHKLCCIRTVMLGFQIIVTVICFTLFILFPSLYKTMLSVLIEPVLGATFACLPCLLVLCAAWWRLPWVYLCRFLVIYLTTLCFPLLKQFFSSLRGKGSSYH